MKLSEVETAYSASENACDRMELISALFSISSPDWQKVEAFAVRVLIHDENPIVRHEAAFVLGELREKGRIGDGAGKEALCRAATQDISPVVRHEAAESIYCFKGSEIEKTLNTLLSDAVEDVRLTAAISLSWRSKYQSWLSNTLWADCTTP